MKPSLLITGLCIGLSCFFAARPASADVVFYTTPSKKLMFVLQGTAIKNAGRTTTFTHPKFGKIYFDSNDIEVKYVPTNTELFTKILAKSRDDADKLMDAANWALRHGLLPQFYLAVDKALAVNPQHPRGLKIRELQAKMNQPIADSSQQERELRKLVDRSDMKIKTSKHFILLHDTSDKFTAPRKMPRAEERLQLLEAVYESFLLRFYAHGVELQVPKERLKVVLFETHKDYLRFVNKLGTHLASTGGFWNSRNNTSVFFDQGTTAGFKELLEVSSALQKIKTDAQKKKESGIGDLVRLADSISMLVEIEHENEDIRVVSHEATHQMAGNTDLLPRHVLIPSWVHEGLASYFETAEGGSWCGIGAVNSERLEWYRELARHPQSRIDFIVGDQIFDFAKSNNAKLHGYGQAWALTHFLMERHFPKFINFYRRMGEMPPDLIVSQEVLMKLFRESFSEETSRLDDEWHKYMDTLKTDLELILEAKK